VQHQFRNSIEDVHTLTGADTDCDHNFGCVYTRMMKIIRFYKEKLRWDLEKLYALQQKGQDTLKEKLSAVICDSGNVEIQVQWNNSKNVCYILWVS